MHLQPLTLATLEPSWHSPAALVASNLRKIGSVSVSLKKDATSPVDGFSISILSSAPTASRIPSAARSDEHSVPVWNPSTHSATCCVQDSGGRLPVSQPQCKQDTAVVSMPFKRLEDFNELRSKIYNLAISLHAFGSTCESCEAALTCVLWGRGQYYQKQRDALLRLVNDEQKLLETLVTIVRNLVVQSTSRDIRVSCRMELELPGIIHNFLFGEAQRK